MDLSRTIEIDMSGNEAGFGAPIKDFFSDASFTLGLFDRLEIGTTLQSFNETDSGGNMWGVFGRAQYYDHRVRDWDWPLGAGM